MPTVAIADRELDCETGANLRTLLLEADVDLYNGPAATVNCRGLGTCGTCAVAVDGPTSDPTAIERARLSVPPHDGDSGLRLACQTSVEGDCTVRKYPGTWGQRTDQSPVDPTDHDE